MIPQLNLPLGLFPCGLLVQTSNSYNIPFGLINVIPRKASPCDNVKISNKTTSTKVGQGYHLLELADPRVWSAPGGAASEPPLPGRLWSRPMLSSSVPCISLSRFAYHVGRPSTFWAFLEVFFCVHDPRFSLFPYSCLQNQLSAIYKCYYINIKKCE